MKLINELLSPCNEDRLALTGEKSRVEHELVKAPDISPESIKQIREKRLRRNSSTNTVKQTVQRCRDEVFPRV